MAIGVLVVKHIGDLVKEPCVFLLFSFELGVEHISIEHDADDGAEGSIQVGVDHVHLEVVVHAVDGVLGWGVEVELSEGELRFHTSFKHLFETTSVTANLVGVHRDGIYSIGGFVMSITNHEICVENTRAHQVDG